ncbi:MAG: hypothetical protein ACI9FJ_000836 [Alteromonadaceae bacterium]
MQRVALDKQNKQRVLMSMGRFEGASARTFNTLQNIAKSDPKDLANTALLSIGSLAKFNPSQPLAVDGFLATKLTESGSETITLAAIKNSGISSFNDAVTSSSRST